MNQDLETGHGTAVSNRAARNQTKTWMIIVAVGVIIVAGLVTAAGLYRRHQLSAQSVSLQNVQTVSGQGNRQVGPITIQSTGSWRLDWSCQAGSKFSLTVQSISHTSGDVTIAPSTCDPAGTFIHGGTGTYEVVVTATGTWKLQVYDYR